MMDLKDPKRIYAKAILFVAIGAIAFAIVLCDLPSLKTAALLLLMVWAFSRAYYFSFYVIEKYIDSSYKFAGLFSFALYLIKKRK